VFEPLPLCFEAPVERYDRGRFGHPRIHLPDDLLAAARGTGGGRPRFEGEIAGRRWDGAAQPAGGGRAMLILSAAFLRRAGVAEGERVRVALRAVDPDEVRLPGALAEALDAAPDLRAAWDGLTAGARRGFVHRVGSARREETRARRVAEVLAALDADAPSPYAARRRRHGAGDAR
jgi:hypothetical protein